MPCDAARALAIRSGEQHGLNVIVVISQQHLDRSDLTGRCRRGARYVASAFRCGKTCPSKVMGRPQAGQRHVSPALFDERPQIGVRLVLAAAFAPHQQRDVVRSQRGPWRRQAVACGHQAMPGSQPDRARTPRTMIARTSTNKATITRPGRPPTGDVPAVRLARASCEMRRNASLTGSGDPPPFAMPQL